MKTSSIKPWRFMPWLLIAPISLFAQPVTEDAPIDDEEVIELSPFEVTGDTDVGYQATSTLAGTRLRTELRDIGSSISIVNEEFLNDTASTNLEDVLVFTPNSEVGGLGGNFSGSQGFGNPIPELQRDNQNGGVTRMRGLAGADLTRDYFISDTPFDTFNTDRVDVQRGANSALFGLGSPGGIVNASTIKADFLGNRGRVRLETDQYGTLRASMRYNFMVNENIAIRIAGLSEDKGYEQKQAFSNDDRFFAAATVKLPWGLTVRGSAEVAERHSARPDFIPPNDAITPWINLGKPTVGTPAEGGATFRETGTYFPGVANSKVITLAIPGSSSGFSNLFQDPSNPAATIGTTAFARRDRGLPNPFGPINGSPGEWMMLMPFTDSEVIWRSGGYRSDGSQVDAGTSDFYKLSNVSYQITDRSIYDYRENLFSGGSSQQGADWEVYTASIEGNYFDNRLGFSVSYFEQSMDTWGNNALQGNMQRSIYIDPNKYLMVPADAANPGGNDALMPNPNYGRPVMGGLPGGNDLTSDRDAFRIQAYYELRFEDFMDESSWLTKLLGTFTLTGLRDETSQYSKEAYSRDTLDQVAVANALAGGDLSGVIWPTWRRSGQLFALPVSNDMNFLNINSISDLAGAGIQGVSHGRARAQNTAQAAGKFWGWNSVDNEFVNFTSAQYNLWDDNNGKTAFYAGKKLTEVESDVLVGQSNLWNNTVVLIGSWRKDATGSASVGAPSAPGQTRVENIRDPNYLAGPASPTLDTEQETTSWSIMVHTPEFIREKMPAGINLSLYKSKSDNFKPTSGRVNVYNESIDPVAGATEEWGFIIEALDGKLSTRVNFFETGLLNNSFDIGGISASEGALLGLAEQLDNPDNVSQGFTDADSRAHLPPQGVQDVNGFVPDWANASATTDRNSSDNGTRDFSAEGMEIEIAYNPIPEWTLLLTVARQETVTDNSYPVLGDYVNSFVIPQWVNSSFAKSFFIDEDATTTLAEYAQANIVNPYLTGSLQDGNPSKEQAEWRWAFNTSYNFGSDNEILPSWLGDFTIGGGVRWEDRIAVGFATTTNQLGDVVEDINNPYWSDTKLFVDIFARARYKLKNDRSFTLQVNIKDLTDNNDLKAFRATPDGREIYRILEGRLVTASATLEF